jgi:hypothetical protein
MRAFVVAALLVGCGPSFAQIDEQNRQRQAQYERDVAEWHRRAALEAEHDRLCLTPSGQAQVNWCAMREREKDRRAQAQQWERENAYRAQSLYQQQQELEAAERERRRQRTRDTFRSPTSCTSNSYGDTTYTNCY